MNLLEHLYFHWSRIPVSCIKVRSLWTEIKKASSSLEQGHGTKEVPNSDYNPVKMAIFIATHKKNTLFLYIFKKKIFSSLKTEIQGRKGLLHFFSYSYRYILHYFVKSWLCSIYADANREKGQIFVKVSVGIDFTIAKQRPWKWKYLHTHNFFIWQQFFFSFF